jgi:hypothetical protein
VRARGLLCVLLNLPLCPQEIEGLKGAFSPSSILQVEVCFDEEQGKGSKRSRERRRRRRGSFIQRCHKRICF